MAVKAATTTVTLKHLAATLAEDNEISKKQSEAILGGLVANIVKHLKKGERIRIGGVPRLEGTEGSDLTDRAPLPGRRPGPEKRVQQRSPPVCRALRALRQAGGIILSATFLSSELMARRAVASGRPPSPKWGFGAAAFARLLAKAGGR